MRITEEKLKKFAVAALVAAGVEESKAAAGAEVLIAADARGIETHGVSKLHIYVQRMKAGGINVKAEPRVVSRVGGLCKVDGDNAMGPIAGAFGAETAVKGALEHGIGMAVVGNSNHFGVTAYYSMKGLDRGVIGFAMSNANPTMAPWGGKQAMVGTSPLSFAIPTAGGLPVVIDMASSLVARGKVIVHAQQKKQLPAGWAFDQNGVETRDPEVALKGLLAPMGGPKGSGLAIIIDILCGVLSGSNWLTGVGHLYTGLDTPPGIGHVFGAVNIAALMKVEDFLATMDEYVAAVHACPRADGVARIYMPGEIEYLTAERSKKEGIPLSDATVADLEKTAADVGLDFKSFL